MRQMGEIIRDRGAESMGLPSKANHPCQRFLRGDVGQGAAPDVAEQRALGQGPVGDHRYVALHRQRQQALRGLLLQQRVVDLQKVDSP
jgi:hypothetical protein